MRGIKMKHGVVFMKRGLSTLKFVNGKWKISNIDLNVLEWDLRTEPPDSYHEFYEEDVMAMGKEVHSQMIELFEKIENVLSGTPLKK